MSRIFTKSGPKSFPNCTEVCPINNHKFGPVFDSTTKFPAIFLPPLMWGDFVPCSALYHIKFQNPASLNPSEGPSRAEICGNFSQNAEIFGNYVPHIPDVKYCKAKGTENVGDLAANFLWTLEVQSALQTYTVWGFARLWPIVTQTKVLNQPSPCQKTLMEPLHTTKQWKTYKLQANFARAPFLNTPPFNC